MGGITADHGEEHMIRIHCIQVRNCKKYFPQIHDLSDKSQKELIMNFF